MRGRTIRYAPRAIHIVACVAATLAIAQQATARTATIEIAAGDREVNFAPVLNAAGQVAYYRFEAVVPCGIGFDCPNEWIRRGEEDASPITIAAETDPVAGLGTTIMNLTPDDTSLKDVGPRITDSGAVMFHAILEGAFVGTTNDTGIFSGNGGGLGDVAREGTASPTGATYTGFDAMAINNIGEQAFIAGLSGGGSPQGVFRRQGAAVTVVQSGDPAPPGDMDFERFGNDTATNRRGIAINNNATSALNQVAFFSLLDAGIGFTDIDTGLYRSRRTGEAPATTLLKRENRNAPGGVRELGQPIINANARTAYYARLNGSPSSGIFLADNVSPSPSTLQLALVGDTTPGTSNTYDGFGQRPALNDLDWIAYKATYSFSDGSGQSEGIYRGTFGGAITTVATAVGVATVEGEADRFFTGVFDDDVAINNKNVTAFSGQTNDAFFFGTDLQRGIYIGAGGGKPAVEVVRTGQPLDGSTVVDFNANLEPNQGGNTGLNDASQVAFQAELADGRTGIYLFTPTLRPHFTASTSYNWNTAGTWQLGFVPPDDAALFLPTPAIYDVAIGDDQDKLPATAATVTTPSATTTLRSLTIGEEGVGPGPSPDITLEVEHIPAETDPTLTVNGPLNVHPIGGLDVIDAGGAAPVVLAAMDSLTNRGRIRLITGGHLGGPAPLDNHGTVAGDGVIDNRLINHPTGEVVVGDNLDMHFTHTGDPALSDGVIGVSINASLTFDENLAASASATTAVEGGTLNLPGDGLANANGMTNNGDLLLLQATINGDVHSPTGSTIEVTDFATFNGLLSGGANIDGGGTVNLNGGYDPGDSPAEVKIGGDVVLGSSNTLTLEVQAPTPVTDDPTPGDDHDLVNIEGSVSLDGTLDIDLLNPGTRPELGTRYSMLTYATRVIATVPTMFATIDGALIDTDFALAPLFVNTGVAAPDDTLVLRASIPGDLNFDNRVSVADLSAFALNFNTNPGLGNWELGDFNTDGMVTVADLSLLALNFGFGVDPSTTPTGLSLVEAAELAGIDLAAVPEPAATTLLTTLLVARGRRCRLASNS